MLEHRADIHRVCTSAPLKNKHKIKWKLKVDFKIEQGHGRDRFLSKFLVREIKE